VPLICFKICSFEQYTGRDIEKRGDACWLSFLPLNLPVIYNRLDMLIVLFDWILMLELASSASRSVCVQIGY